MNSISPDSLVLVPRAYAGTWHLLIVLLLLAAHPALAVDLPFVEQAVVSGFDARSVAAADLDGDGDLDLLGAAEAGGDVTWWENTAGDGSAWTTRSVDSSFNGARFAAAGDIDGDGDLAVLAVSVSNDTVSWWENTGFAWAQVDIDTAFDQAIFVTSADLDGDGDLDVLAAGAVGAGIAWWENAAGDGSAWSKTTIDAVPGFSARGAAIADVDGDGDLDVLGTDFLGDAITWYENTAGDGSAWTKSTVGGSFDGASAVVAADIDGDGDLDAVGAAVGDSDIAWWENTAGDGSAWSRTTVDESFGGAVAVAAVDLDRDGDIDILGAASSDDEITWWENTGGDGSLWTEHTVGSGFNEPAWVATADVDGDGDVDVLGAARFDDEIAWWENETIHSSALFASGQTIDGSFGGARFVVTGDVDGDGDVDVLGTAVSADILRWWENTMGDGSVWSGHTIDPDFDGFHLATADLDGDGDLDVVGAERENGGDYEWWENTAGDGSAWTRRLLAEGPVASDAGCCPWLVPSDLDEDGDLDLVTGDADRVFWHENTAGDGSSWSSHPTPNVGSAQRTVAVTDLDADGDFDLISVNSQSGQLFWFENTVGDASAWTQHSVGTIDGLVAVWSADVDGDGDPDLLGAAENADVITWWDNGAGDGSAWTRRTVAVDFDGAAMVSAGDIDGDGDLDVVAAARVGGEIAWWENAGDGLLWTDHLVDGNVPGTTSVALGDLDGDGDLDLVGSSTADGTVIWWENRGSQFALVTSDVAPARATAASTVAALQIDAFHRGRVGDADAELATLELLLEDGSGAPLSDAQADALLSELAIYVDDGSGTFDPELDAEVASAASFSLDAGVLTVPFTDNDPSLAISFGSAKRFFVVLTFEATAPAAIPDDIRVTHLAVSSTAEDATYDLPLAIEGVGDTASRVIEVNDPAVAAPDAVEILEDAGTVSGNVLDGSSGGLDADEENDPLASTALTLPSHGTLVGGLADDGGFTYQPAGQFFGQDSFTYEVDDGIESGSSTTVTITVIPVNDPPGFDLIGSISVDQGSGAQSFPGFVVAFNAGPPNESGQLLTFSIVDNSAPELFDVLPAISSEGTLTFTATPSAVGTATVTVELIDDGGTANGGVDTSTPQTFEIIIADVFAPSVESIAATPGGLLSDCAELRGETSGFVVTFDEAMADPPGDDDPEDVTNPVNYRLLAAGPNRDLETVACNAVAGDDVVLVPAGVTWDAGNLAATVAFSSLLADDLYRLVVCDGLEDPSGNTLASETAVTFRQTAGNLFASGQLDCSLGEWVAVSDDPGEISHSSEDLDGALASGSVHVTNLVGTMFAIGQCVDTLEATVTAKARIRIDQGEGLFSTACQFFAEAGCTGALLSQGSESQVLSDTGGAWIEESMRIEAGTATSALCSFDIQILAGTTCEAYLDDLRLEGPLFGDGFESGDTTAWSFTTN
jgi:hypothetical protein